MGAVNEHTYDVAIVGGGPAGSSAAIRLANAGLSVLLAEQKKFPREKLCGEFISPECLVHFQELGVMQEIAAAGGVDLRETVFYGRNGKGVAVESKWFGNADSLALGLSRAEMDLRLLNRARETGVTICEETNATGLLIDDATVKGIRLKDKSGAETSVSAKLTIDATGRKQSLARHVKKQTSEKKRAEFVAFKTHLRGARVAPGACEIYVFPGGYGGCSRVENDLYNVCFIASAKDAKRFGSDAERVMREVVCTNLRAAESLRNAEVVEVWHAVTMTPFGRGSLIPAKGLIAVGDAATFIDPFTGSGILLALESAKIAAAAIAHAFAAGLDFDSIAAQYQRNYSSAFDSRLRVCSMLRHAAFVPFLAEVTIAALSLSGNLRRRIARATRVGA
jgi:flavin-dependent dehydrogenase